jgi:hypothetical protein
VNWIPSPDQRAFAATKHGKDVFVGAVFGPHWGLHVEAAYVDTDLLGTFSGEVPRPGDVRSTLRAKVRMALKVSPDADVVLATEGSFGPDPVLGWVPLHEEVLLWSWPRQGKELWVAHRSHDTNFSSSDSAEWTEVQRWALRVGFPTAHVILRDPNGQVLAKGISDPVELERLWRVAAEGGAPRVETDMRANRNPKRQEVLRALANKTLEAFEALCPSCQFPGFVARPAEPGAPCSACGSATRRPRLLKAECTECGQVEVRDSDDQLNGVDPAYCDRCNP